MLARRIVEAFNGHDVEAFITALDPSVEYHSVMTVPGGAAYHGHDGVRRYFRDFKDAWGDDFHVEPDAFFDLGQDTLMFYVLHGRGQQSGAEVTMPGAQVCRWATASLSTPSCTSTERTRSRTWASRRMHSSQLLRNTWAYRSKTPTPTPEPAGYCAGDVSGERGDHAGRFRGLERGGHGCFS
jgi:hypothetical protein